MIANDLHVKPFNTTLMGVIRGVADAFGLNHSDATLFGGSGHAFVINIHDTLCPSGPYCWHSGGFDRLLGNLGINRQHHGFFGGNSGPSDRAAIESVLKEQLDQGVPCALLNLENQLITGYDDSGFVATQPWAHADFPPAHLTWGSWEELGNEIHVSFYWFKPAEPADECTILNDALSFAVDMGRHPTQHTDEPYGAGLKAYDKWIAALEAGHGGDHGNWWNGTVWSECRVQASAYLSEVAARHPGVATLSQGLAASYADISASLARAADKELEPADKLDALRSARATEVEVLEHLEALLADLPRD